MRLLLLVVGGLLAATTEAVTLNHNPRLFASAMRIQRLHHEIEELDHEIDDAAKIDPFGFIEEMHARLDEVGGRVVYSILTVFSSDGSPCAI